MNESSQATTAETIDKIRAAQKLIKQDRRQGLAALNDIFRAGKPPDPPLDGPYDGELLAVDIAPGVNQFVDWVTSFFMPWKGKQLSAADSRGDNLFGRKSRLFFRLNFPFYWGVCEDRPDTFRAFVFKTSIATGKEDPDRQVFRIDYDSPDNPAFNIRRIIDEVVQVGEGLYLGKIHFKWWWGSWKMIGYFMLRPRGGTANASRISRRA